MRIEHPLDPPGDEPLRVGERRLDSRQLFDYAPFKCPENEFLATAFPVGSGATILMPSYSTSIVFLMKPRASSTGGYREAFNEWNPPGGYVPKITKVGDASRKVYIADGGKRSDNANAPTYSTQVRVSLGGAYGDQPPFTQFTKAWYRGVAPGNGHSGFDARLYGFRHGSDKPNGQGDQYRMNVGYFDGHVDNLGDMQACDPSLWVPKGSSVNLTTGQVFNDFGNVWGPRYGAAASTVINNRCRAPCVWAYRDCGDDGSSSRGTMAEPHLLVVLVGKAARGKRPPVVTATRGCLAGDDHRRVSVSLPLWGGDIQLN